ncbi:MAG: porin [Burkholderiales bacterium]|nr:porin [Burkholderiales bacterium]
MQHYATPSTSGADVGNMGTLRNDRTALTSNVAPRATLVGEQWSNSYIGFRGQLRPGPVTVGYDVQGEIDLRGKFRENFRTRDAYVYAEHPMLGRLTYGQFDTMYKEAGDPVRMLGISSGNIVSTARVVSGVGWSAAGPTTFNNRVNHMWAWLSPAWRGFNVGVSHSTEPVDTLPHLEPSLSAVSLQWRDGPWYAALATEVHKDWLPMSLGTSVPAATSIRNLPASARSRDQGWRLSGAWTDGPWRVGADVARLRYTEDDTAALAGKFREYGNTTGQVSVEYRWSKQLRLAAHHARATAGSCGLSGGVACSTNGLGGHQTAVGAMLAVNDMVGVFALAVRVGNGAAARYGSSAQGAATNIYAVGLRLSSK